MWLEGIVVLRIIELCHKRKSVDNVVFICVDVSISGHQVGFDKNNIFVFEEPDIS